MTQPRKATRELREASRRRRPRQGDRVTVDGREAEVFVNPPADADLVIVHFLDGCQPKLRYATGMELLYP